MNTTQPTTRYHYRRIAAYGDHVVIAAYASATGRYLCRLFLVRGGEWSNGRSRHTFRDRDRAVDAYLDREAGFRRDRDTGEWRGGRIRHIGEV